MNDYDIMSEASDLVDCKLAMLEALQESRKFQIDTRSRIVCRCPSCRSANEKDLAWLHQMRASSQQPAG